MAALGCADAGARLVARLIEPTPEPAHTRPAKVPASWGRYVVQPGDTLGSIAACRRVPVAVLARVNRIAAPDRLLARTVLRVPKRGVCASPQLARKAQPGRADAARLDAGGELHGEARRLLATATTRYDEADFEQALSLARACIEALVPHPEGDEADALRARCHVVAGMAAAGLERRERAIAEFRRALAFDPDVALDPERSSPRVLELVHAARASPGASDDPSENFVDSSTRSPVSLPR